MSDYYGALSSSSFRVKDRDAWLADPAVQKLKDHAAARDGFLDEDEPNQWSFGWTDQYPSLEISWWDEDRNEEGSLNLTEVIQSHIADGEVCKVAVGGHEKLKYVGGSLTLITSKGIAYLDTGVSWDEKLSPESVKEPLDAFLTVATEILRRSP